MKRKRGTMDKLEKIILILVLAIVLAAILFMFSTQNSSVEEAEKKARMEYNQQIQKNLGGEEEINVGVCHCSMVVQTKLYCFKGEYEQVNECSLEFETMYYPVSSCVEYELRVSRECSDLCADQVAKKIKSAEHEAMQQGWTRGDSGIQPPRSADGGKFRVKSNGEIEHGKLFESDWCHLTPTEDDCVMPPHVEYNYQARCYAHKPGEFVESQFAPII